MTTEPIYYFGCWRNAGHFLHAPDGRSMSHEAIGPFDVYGREGFLTVDGAFAPGPFSAQSRRGNPEDDTAVALTHIRGWSVLAMWDRSIDTRGACNAAFIAEGSKDMAEMWALARLHFPTIVARLKAAPKEQR